MKDEVTSICRHASGYLELGMPEDALSELQSAPADSTPVLLLTIDCLFMLERWEQAAELCLPQTKKEPHEPGWWIQAAFAVRRARSLAEAEPILRSAIALHPDHGLICYNLACYTCLRGELEEAKELLTRAFKIDVESILQMACCDDDLIEIRPWIIDHHLAVL